MLEKTERPVVTARVHRAPLIIRRIDAIPVALPLKNPMKMAGITIGKAENLLVRVESTSGEVGSSWYAASVPRRSALPSAR